MVDFGCAELKFVRLLTRSTDLDHILCVDIDKELITNCKYKILPLSTDYLNRRPLPLQIDLFQGSIDEPDTVLQDVDAVIGIEMSVYFILLVCIGFNVIIFLSRIEHLYPETLENLPFNIFGYIRPRIAIFTTPNEEFNHLFKLTTRFRHYDHKFEWTRDQFEDWANNICTRFPEYEATFAGIGFGPKGSEHLGCVSQMVVFIRKDNCQENCRSEEVDVTNSYQLINSVKYPFDDDKRTPMEKLFDNISYHVGRMKMFDDYQRYFHFENMNFRIPLTDLKLQMNSDISVKDLLDAIVENEWFKMDDHVIVIDAYDEVSEYEN